jgi:hypothetical protein
VKRLVFLAAVFLSFSISKKAGKKLLPKVN